MARAKLITIILLTAFSVQSFAQPMFYFRNLDVSKGLPSNIIHSFCEDEQGFIWIGTQDGLVRYDGISFENFYQDPADSTSIAGNNISWDIKEDDRGRIWIALHGRGLSRFDPRDNTFTNFSYANGKFKDEWTNNAEHLVLLPDNNVLLICQRGIVKIDSADEVQVLMASDQPEYKGVVEGVRSAFLHNERWLWLNTSLGFVCYDLVESQWETAKNNPRELPLLERERGVYGVGYADGTVWFSTFFQPDNSPHRFLYSFNFETNALDSVPVAPNTEKVNPFSDQVHTMHIQKDGTIWLGTEGIGLMGLVAYDPRSKEWTQYFGNSDWTGSILPGPVRALFEDSNHNMWIGTERGVSLMAADRQYFSNYAETRNNSGQVVPLNGIRSIAISEKGNIWLQNDGKGLLQLATDKSLKRAWVDLKKTSGPYRNYLVPRLVRNDTLLFHAWYNGMYAMDLNNENVFHYAPLTDVNEREIRDGFLHSNGDVFAYGWGRFGRLDPRTGKFDFVRMPASKEERSDMVWNATEDGQGNIWLATARNGLLCIDPSRMSIVDSWKRDTTVYRTTSVWSVMHKDGKLYFTLDKTGLGVLDLDTRELQMFSKKDGLCSDEVGGVLKDAKGGIWLYSSSGISWFDEGNNRFRTFTEADGMISENVLDAELHPNGQMVLVTDRGLIEFDPQQLKMTSNSQKPSLRAIQVYDQTINLHKWKQDSATVTVPYDRNYLRVEFSALEFFDPEKIRFAYRLDEAEQRWNYTDHRPVAIYTNLGGGHYRLCVKQTNVDGAWGPETCIPIFVTTPFYRQMWFILLVILLVAIGSFFIYRWQLRKKLAVLEVRNQLSRDLHDDIGSALSSINIFSSVAEQQLEKDKDEAQKLLQRIGSSARSMMQSMDDIIWSIDPNNDEVEQLLARMRAFAIPVLEAKDILLKMDADESILKLKLDMVKRRNLFLIFKEAINNLAKYSQSTTAQVVMQIDQGKLKLTIKDDGAGFDVDKKSERHGLSNMKKRAEELGGNINISSQKDQGSTVSVEIPLT